MLVINQQFQIKTASTVFSGKLNDEVDFSWLFNKTSTWYFYSVSDYVDTNRHDVQEQDIQELLRFQELATPADEAPGELPELNVTTLIRYDCRNFNKSKALLMQRTRHLPLPSFLSGQLIINVALVLSNPFFESHLIWISRFTGDEPLYYDANLWFLQHFLH